MIKCYELNFIQAAVNTDGQTLLGFKEATEVNCKHCGNKCLPVKDGNIQIHASFDASKLKMNSNSFDTSFAMNCAPADMEEPESS